MRQIRRTAQTATSPDLARFRRLVAGQRVRLRAVASAADGVTLEAQLGDKQLFNGTLPIESAAGSHQSGVEIDYLFDYLAPFEGELVLTFTPGANTYDLVLEVDP